MDYLFFYTMNYDFKANWNDIVVPLLKLPKVKRSLKNGIIKFLDETDTIYKYSSTQCPASFMRTDVWSVCNELYEEKITEKLLQTGYLKRDTNEPQNEDDFDEYTESKQYQAYLDYKENALRPFMKHHETSLEAYQLFGACHWYNPTFGLTLAKLIYPNEHWYIKSGIDHTTIANKDHTLVFDILYFDEFCESKGGSKALLNSN